MVQCCGDIPSSHDIVNVVRRPHLWSAALEIMKFPERLVRGKICVTIVAFIPDARTSVRLRIVALSTIKKMLWMIS